MAMDGAERSKKLRDKEKEQGIQRLVMKITETERGWIQEAQDVGGYEDHTELILHLVQRYNEENREKQ